MTSFQDTLLLSSYTNDLAIVPDLNLSRKRSTACWGEDLFESDLLQELSVISPKRSCVREPSPLENTSSYFKPTYYHKYVQPISDTPVNAVVFSGQVFKDSRTRARTSMQKTTPPSPPYVEDRLQSINSVGCAIKLVITEEPEQYYRARYDSEGVRAPLKGIHDSYPAVQIIGQPIKHAVITVKLVHEDGSEHTCCSLDSSDDRKKALTKKVNPANKMKAEFEDLRIRREKKKEGRKGNVSLDKSSARDGKHDKVACLLFTATVETEHGRIECSVMSSPISLTAAPEPAELDWLEPSRGHFGGKEVVVIKGSKMTSPKVLFRVLGPNGEIIELPGTVDKDKSHQNVLLVRTPVINHLPFAASHTPILTKVVVITGRSQMYSNNLDFEFIPDDLCRECMQETSPNSLKVSSNLCRPNPTFTFGTASCPPMTSEAPKVQSSPFSPDVIQSGVSTPAHSAPLQFDTLPVLSVRSCTVSPTVSVTGGEPVDLTIPATGGNMQAYTICDSPLLAQPSAIEGCETKDHQSSRSSRDGSEDWMEIMQQLMSPDSTSSVEDSLLSPHQVHSTSGQCSPRAYLPENVLHPDTQTHKGNNSTTQETFKCIEKLLWDLHHENMLSQSDLMIYVDLCRCCSMDILNAYNTALGDNSIFLQHLASIKLSSFRSTRQ